MSKRLMATIVIVILVLVVALVATRLALSPFAIKGEQVEGETADIPSEEEMKERQMAEMEATVVAVEEPMPPGGEAVALASGSFHPLPRGNNKMGEGAGTAIIYQLPNGGHILRLENFFVTNGPDLRVWLAVKDKVESQADLEEGWLDLGPLKGNKGNQNYGISSDTEPGEYNSVVIWCKPFEIPLAIASLTEQTK